MKLKVLFFALAVALGTACSNDPDGNSLNGTWKLTNASVADGMSLEYNPGEVIWTFNETNSRLDVVNNVYTLGPENIYSGIASGSYTFLIRKEDGVKILYVNGQKQGAMATTNDNLVINSGTDTQGIKKVFSR